MKFVAFFATLVSAVSGSTDVAPASRDLAALTDKYQVLGISASESANVITMEALHNEGTGSGGHTEIWLFKGGCKHGASSPSHSDYLGDESVTWLTTANPSTNPKTEPFTSTSPATDYKTTWAFSVNSGIASQAGVWDTPSADQAKFCIFFGQGTSSSTLYGFMELEITMTFSTDGTWSINSFTTQAFGPVQQTVGTTYTATASSCSSTTPVKPGFPGCIQVKPQNDNLGMAKITDITGFTIKDVATSGALPDLLVIGTGSTTPYSVKCDDGTGNVPVEYGSATTTIAKYACQVTFLFPYSYFPTAATPGSGAVTTFKVEGGTSTMVLAVRRQLENQDERALAEEVVEADIEGSAAYVLAPADDSSAGSLVVGAAAAAGAIGAALLL